MKSILMVFMTLWLRKAKVTTEFILAWTVSLNNLTSYHRVSHGVTKIWSWKIS